MTTENLERLLNEACQLLIIFENSNTCTEEDKNRISAIFNELKYADDIEEEIYHLPVFCDDEEKYYLTGWDDNQNGL